MCEFPKQEQKKRPKYGDFCNLQDILGRMQYVLPMKTVLHNMRDAVVIFTWDLRCGAGRRTAFVFPASYKSRAMRARLNQEERSITHAVGPEIGAEAPRCTAISGELDWSATTYIADTKTIALQCTRMR